MKQSMRYLNKVIFIESANTRYAEIKLDGNVHLIGTQGVGKSTLLRALLFFYNANQQKLGIPIEKKRFIDFYFQYQNSFIVYEVMHENGPFSVITYKSRGRVVFRFVNSAYQKTHFIDQTNGQVADSWDVVRDNLSRDGVKYTRMLDRYEEYRDIIYGNNKGLRSEFRKYALLESKQYQNIPRAIQHVFLNYKVESDFIKDTIIKSLDDEEIPIDLSNYTFHLKDFETQLNDIRLWTEQPARGENRIRKLAGKIIETFSHIRYIEQDFSRLSGELMIRLHDNDQQLTKLEAMLTKEEEKKKSALEQQMKSLKYYDERKAKLSEEKGVFVNKLREARQKSDEYQLLHIDEILSRIDKKSELMAEQKDIASQKILLESNFNDIRQKYERQIEQLHNQFESFRNGQHEKLYHLKDEFFRFKESLSEEYVQVDIDIKEQFKEQRLQASKRVEDIKEELLRLQNKRFEIKHRRYYEEEITKYKEQIYSDNEKSKLALFEIDRLENDNATLKRQWELEEERLKEVAESEKSEFMKVRHQLSVRIDEIRTRIENSKDSLYGWLNDEYPGWEKTIGKVIDEEQVLFSSGLSPEKVSFTQDSFYGIKINLDEIEKNIKTVSDYEAEIEALKAESEKIRIKINETDKRLVEQLEKSKKKYLPRIKENKERVVKCKYDLSQYKIASDKANIELDGWQRKAEEDKRNHLDEIIQHIDKTNVAKTEAGKEMDNIEHQTENKIKAKQKEKVARIEDRQKQLDTDQHQIALAITNKESETAIAVEELKANQDKELENKGADTRKINLLQGKLNVIEAELKYIEENSELVFNYKKDKKELLDRIDYFSTHRDLLDGRLKEIESRQENQQQKQKAEQEQIRTRIDQLNNEIAAIEEDAHQFAEFQQTDAYTDHIALFEYVTGNLSAGKNGVTIIGELTNNYYSRIKHMETLRENVQMFTGNFSEQNIFKFKTRLVEESEYRQFAEELQEFIEEDKISEYEKRVNELFARIIQQVGNETEQLLSKESAIRKVVNEINADFRQKNFVGVIKSIELRVVPSSNKIVQLLGEIKQFNDDNLYNFGEVNLFNSEQQSREENNRKAVQYLSALNKSISGYRNSTITLTDSFELEFRVVENDNDTGWVDKLANVGSDGTDVLVKAMINIMLLNVFKEGATRNQFKDFRLHCMMDEIGKLHPNNVRGILKFANDRNIFLVNGSPQSFDALAYRYTYQLSKKRDAQLDKEITVIHRIVTNNRV
ncbi:MAG: ATP-binding protein [Porphyromonadaceae bacterium]|nr:ATP-binding protein [Porphyromonadaceae bacterium]